MGRSLTVKVMELLGFKHVPDKTVQVIERNGRYHRNTTRTFARHWPFFESFGPQIQVGLQVVDQMYRNVKSSDGVMHNISVSTKAFFDVCQVDPMLMAVVVQYPELIVKSRIQAIVDMVLREEVGLRHSTELLQAGVINQIVQAIKQSLTKDLKKFGGSLPSEFLDDTLYIKEILPPERMHENRVEATNILETIDSLSDQDREEVKRAVFAHLSRDMGTKQIQIRAMNLPEDASNPDQIAASDHKFPVLRQPGGRIYDN